MICNGEETYAINGVKCSRSEFYAYNQAKRNPRPLIGMNALNKVTHNGIECRVVMRNGLIRVACTDVTPAALRHLLKQYDDNFSNHDEITVQAGKE